MVILEKIIIIILLLFPLGELIRINITNDVTIHPIDIGIALLVVVWLIIQIKDKKNLFKIKNSKPILLFSLISIISLLANIYWLKLHEFAISILYLFRWLMYTGIYFAAKDTSQQFKKKFIKPILLFDGLIILTGGFLQLYFYPSLINLTHYQWDRHVHRLFSVFLDPNYTGIFLVLFLIFTSTRLLKHITDNNQKYILLYGLVSVASIIAVFLTYSRSAIVTLITSGIVFLTLIKKKMLITILIGLILAFIVISSPNFYIENMNLFRVHSSRERIESAKVALQTIERNPLLGVGFNTYRYAQIKYNFRVPSVGFSSHADAGTDNSFLFVTATTGIIGLTSYIYLWYKLLEKHYKKRNEYNNTKHILVLSSFAGLCIGSQFINALFFAPIMIWMWFILAIMD